ncbi:MAG: hypothetical protein NZ772_04625 [Cyanobacteria bacterium]|nr:hypothetical protein [Cyanobacteriota bacterium]MDW8200712.1 hypothetical protein [Cyanobacteriota bacterium SKYGB_h_bin112]
MHPQIEAIFDEAENRYLKPEELTVLNQYVDSLPARLEVYQVLRDRELEIMQPVADQLQAQLPSAKSNDLERSLKNALLTLRYCAMAMLLNDESFVQERLLSWLKQKAQLYNTQEIDTVLYRLLDEKLGQFLNPAQIGLLSPFLQLAKTQLVGLTSAHA